MGVLSRHIVAAAIAGEISPLKRVVVEFFYDTSSPWTYMAFSRIRELCARTNTELSLKPMLVGGVFNQANQGLYAMRDKMMAKTDSSKPQSERTEPSAKEVWADKDLSAWASYLGLDIKTMGARFNARKKDGSPGHPISAVKMLRGAIIAQEEGEEALVRFSFASFDAYWGSLRDVSDDAELGRLHAEAGLRIGVEDFLRRIAGDADVKARLRTNTDEVVRRGGFGSPMICVGCPDDPSVEMFSTFGNDRFELVEAAVLRAQGRLWRFHDVYAVPPILPGPVNHKSGSSRTADGTGVVDERLALLGIAVPESQAPAANYVPFRASGQTVYISGQLPKDGGGLAKGKVGADYGLEQAKAAARVAGINLIAQMKAASGGDLDRVRQILSVQVFVNCTDDFQDHPAVANGVSDLLVEVFGKETGAHSRFAVGCSSLPLGVVVEAGAVVEIV